MGNDYTEALISVLDEGNDIIYLSDPENYKLYYLNKRALYVLGNPKREEWFEKPCYQVLCGSEIPCDCCTKKTHARNNDIREYFNNKMGLHLQSKDMIIEINNRNLHVGIAIDVSEQVKLENRLKAELSVEKALVKCAGILNQYNKKEKFASAAEDFLHVIAEYYEAECAYALWIDFEKEDVADAFRWHIMQDKSTRSWLKEVSFDKINDVLCRLVSDEEKVLVLPHEAVPDEGAVYRTLFGTETNSLLLVPVRVNEAVAGLLGVKNPAKNLDTAVLLKSAAVFLTNEMKHRMLRERITYLSHVDELTGAGNRRSYLERLGQLGKNESYRFGILVADIDGLRMINNAYGHQWGDFMLIHTAEVLKSFFGEDVYRIGEDEFMAFGKGMDKGVFESIAKEIGERAKWDEQFQVSVGSSYYDGESDIEFQISIAGEKMNLTKVNHYSEMMDGAEVSKQRETKGKYQTALSEKLKDEIRSNRFQVFLQPQINLKSGKIGGAEALVRYIDAKGHIVPPVSFIDKYESEGLIRYIDMHMLESVCQLIKKWKMCGMRTMNISVNFSRITLMEENIVKKMRAICDEYGVHTHMVTIEITENMGLLERQELQELLAALQRMGFSISLDDFGSRYSDLAILSIADFDEIKLDKSLVDQIESKGKSRTIAEYILHMCRDMELTHTVAEGIETIPQREILKRYGCELGQGYLFDKPMPVSDFERKYIEH